MSASKLSDLLPIQTSGSKPNAYQVFGLTGAEQDPAKVTEAMQRVYEGLKASKATADPAVWKQAAKLAEAARKVLEDPQQRRALDASLSPSVAAAGGEADDPLASLLPKSKPLSTTAAGAPTTGSTGGGNAAILGIPPGLQPPGHDQSAAPTSSAARVLGTPPLGTPPEPAAPSAPEPAPAASSTPTVSPEPAAVNWAPAKSKTKRRKKNYGLFFFGLFVVVMLAAIVGLLQFLTQGGQIAVGPSGVQVDQGVVVAEPMPAAEEPRPDPRRSDGVLGDVAASGIADSLRRPGGDSDTNNGSGLSGADPMNNNTSDNRDAGSGIGAMVPEMPTTNLPDTTQTPPATGSSPEPEPPSQPTPAMVTANQEKLDAVAELIRSADWDAMKSSAEALLKQSLTAEQSKRASALFDIADLATFYRGAIGRGLATLNTGSTFDYVDGVPVIVVEASGDSLSIKFNNRTRSFTVDDMPPRLTEKITSFALSPERPDAIAGQALYRLIHPKWRAEYREDTFEMLATIDGELEQVDTRMLQQVARELFAE